MPQFAHGNVSEGIRFHVKHKQTAFQSVALSLPLGVVLALFLAGNVQAEVHKCTGADNKVVFSDQPCASGQTASHVSGVGTTAATDKTGTDKPSYEDSVQRSRRATVHAALTPDCRVLGDQASRALRNDAASLDEVKQAVSQFENHCGDQVHKASVAAAKSRTVPDAADCHRLRQSLEERRARIKTMTNRELQEFVKFQNEVSVGCR